MEINREGIAGARQEVEKLLKVFANSGNQNVNHTERDTALFNIFAHCGVAWQSGVKLNTGKRSVHADGDFQLTISGKTQRFLLEISNSTRPVIVNSTIKKVKWQQKLGQYDRALIVIPRDIPDKIRRKIENSLIGSIDLLGVSDLRSWLCKHIPALQENEAPQHQTCAHIIRQAMRAVAERLAQAPDEIGTIEWRDLERVLREVFEGMGFDTTLTRSSKDDGFDLELVTNTERGKETYLVEVKHWTEQKPGKTYLKKLVRVTARQKASYGILLSSSGFAPSIFEGITLKERKTVGVGDHNKIISLCKTYYRIGKQIWEPGTSITDTLMADLI